MLAFIRSHKNVIVKYDWATISPPKRADGEVTFAFTPHATRDGVRFGASQRPRHFSTIAERDEKIEEYFANARKRATR